VSFLITSILFDVDDTLYDQQQPFRNAVTSCFPQIAHKDLTALYLRFRVHSDEQFGRVLENEWTLDHFRYFRLTHSLTDLGYLPITIEESCKFQLCYEQELDAITLHPEVESTLNYLSTLPVKLGIITNGPTDHQQKKLDQLQLTRWIKPEHMIISQATGYQKPQLEIFQLAETAFALDPETTLYVGDNFDNDVVGCKKAGWQALWFNHRLRQAPSGLEDLPDASITAFSQLQDSIDTLMQVPAYMYN